MNLRKYILPLLIVLFLAACEKEEEIYTNVLTSESLYNLMEEAYLWNDKLPKNPDLRKSPHALLEDLRYKPIDRWSFIMPTSEFNSYFNDGEYEGYGFSYSYDFEGNVRISVVFKDSPLYLKGVRRGWILKSINSKLIDNHTNIDSILYLSSAHNFVFINDFDKEISFYAEKKIIEINTVLLDTVYELNNYKIGYLVFNSFISNSKAELLTSFKKFKENNINELIVDLRYNTGGQSDVGYMLGGLIGGDKVKGEIIVNYMYNKNMGKYNSSNNFTESENSVNINEVIFITTGNTASASELVINGLTPFLDVVLVGDDTHGKPVGMNVWQYVDYTVAPITFTTTNAEYYGDYYNGLKADSYVIDDVTKDFGNIHEACLDEAIYYINNKSFKSLENFKNKKIEREYPVGLKFFKKEL